MLGHCIGEPEMKSPIEEHNSPNVSGFDWKCHSPYHLVICLLTFQIYVHEYMNTCVYKGKLVSGPPRANTVGYRAFTVYSAEGLIIGLKWDTSSL